MNLFEYATSKTKQGDIGKFRGMYEYARLGYTVLTPLTDSDKYDFVIHKEKFERVQAKTTTVQNDNGSWDVFIATSGGNTKVHTRKINRGYDLLFVVNAVGECWSIPIEHITANIYIKLGNTKYNEFKI